jgi:hypothetical protein
LNVDGRCHLIEVVTEALAKPVARADSATQPPERLVWSVKGRLQHLVRRRYPRAFQQNYGLRSVALAAREAIEG